MSEILEFNKTNFATLEDAQAYKVYTETHQVTSGKAGAWFGTQTTMYNVLEGQEPRQLLAVMQEIRNDTYHPLFSLMKLIDDTLQKNSYFGIDPSKPLGQGNRQSLSILVSTGVLTQAQADEFLSLSISVNQPYKDKTQEEYDKSDLVELELGNNPNEHIITFNISESLDKPEQVKILCRYGSTGDLTPWHDCTQRQIRFKQDTYKVFIPSCEHEVRELKIISPVGLTVS